MLAAFGNDTTLSMRIPKHDRLGGSRYVRLKDLCIGLALALMRAHWPASDSGFLGNVSTQVSTANPCFWEYFWDLSTRLATHQRM
jgi:hypothetical protein